MNYTMLHTISSLSQKLEFVILVLCNGLWWFPMINLHQIKLYLFPGYICIHYVSVLMPGLYSFLFHNKTTQNSEGITGLVNEFLVLDVKIVLQDNL